MRHNVSNLKQINTGKHKMTLVAALTSHSLTVHVQTSHAFVVKQKHNFHYFRVFKSAKQAKTFNGINGITVLRNFVKRYNNIEDNIFSALIIIENAIDQQCINSLT